ncbi:hypothetical protein D3C80_903900 [compost metagenome]
MARICQLNSPNNLPRRIVTLNRCWIDNDGQGRVATLQHMQNIMQRCTGFGGNDTDAVRRGGQWLFELLIEQTFR